MLTYERVAFGLTKHPSHGYRHLLGRFAQHINGITYWDIYVDDTLDATVMAQRLVDMMINAKSIHFNLDGMISGESDPTDIYQSGALGAGEGNWTNWEFYIILSTDALFGKTTFYFNGIIVKHELTMNSRR
ncbi:MAG: hypothetical protein AAF702_32560 [Chloroflexota bacterium]